MHPVTCFRECWEEICRDRRDSSIKNQVRHVTPGALVHDDKQVPPDRPSDAPMGDVLDVLAGVEADDGGARFPLTDDEEVKMPSRRQPSRKLVLLPRTGTPTSGCHFFERYKAFLETQRSAKVVLILGYKKLSVGYKGSFRNTKRKC